VRELHVYCELVSHDTPGRRLPPSTPGALYCLAARQRL
jgi:hypothetical protein